MDEEERQTLGSQLEFTEGLRLQAVSQSDTAGALDHQQSIIEIVRQLHGDGSKKLLDQLQVKAGYESWLGFYDDAIETLKGILENEKDIPEEVEVEVNAKEPDAGGDDENDDDEPFSFRSVRNDLADALSQSERYEEAEAIYQQLLEDVDKSNERHRLGVVLVKKSLALLFAECGRDDEALRSAHEAIDLAMKEFGEGDGFLRAARLTLADVYFIQGDFESCLKVREQVHSETVKEFGEDHIWATETKDSLARAWAVTGREAEAKEILEATAVLHASVFPSDESSKSLTKKWYQALATPHPDGSGYGDVEEMQNILQKMKNRNTRPDMGLSGPDGRLMLRDTFRVYRKFGNLGDILYALEESYMGSVDRLGEEHFVSAQLLELFAECCIYAGAYNDVIEQLEQVKSVYERVSGPEAPRTVRCKAYLRSLQDADGQLDPEKGANLLQLELEGNQKNQGVSSHAAFAATVGLAAALDAFGRIEEAQTQLRKVVISPLDNGRMANRALKTAKLFEQFGLEAEAKAIYIRLLPVFELEQGVVSTEVLTAALALARCCEGAGERDIAIDVYKKLIDRGAILAGTDSSFVSEASIAWTMVNIYQGVSDEESWKIPKDYIKDNSSRWKAARKTKLGSFGSLLPDLEKLNIGGTQQE